MKTQLILGLALGLAAAVCAGPMEQYEKNDDARYGGLAARQVADTLLTWQSPEGSWPKNVDTSVKPYTGDPNALSGTFDNGATIGEMQFLARVFKATNNERYKTAFLRGFDHIIKAQYPSGGWPQFYPPGRQYHRHITFNDNTMIHVMSFLRDASVKPDYDFLDEARRTAARIAVDRGIDCILKCQIKVHGKLTVWCAQHDEIDFSPRAGRSFELVSLSGSESAGILRFLMSLDNPSPEVIGAVTAGAQWYEESVVKGIRIQETEGNRTAVADPAADPLWARFYEIETNQPFVADRNGIKYYEFNQLEPDRRNGYRWYGEWGNTVANDYRKWKERIK